jgi:hypothetical protein
VVLAECHRNGTQRRRRNDRDQALHRLCQLHQPHRATTAAAAATSQKSRTGPDACPFNLPTGTFCSKTSRELRSNSAARPGGARGWAESPSRSERTSRAARRVSFLDGLVLIADVIRCQARLLSRPRGSCIDNSERS